jgi:hypothetical protein
MKKIIMLVFVVLVLSACAPVVQGFVDLPDGQEKAINGIFVAVGALLLDFLIGKFAWLEFFRQYKEAWSLALSALAIRGLEQLLPTGSEELSVQAVALLIAVALYLLSRTFLQRKGVQAFAK